MRVSVVTMTKNSGGHLGWWLERARRYADEIVVAVDRTSTDDTYEVARAGADGVHVLELPGYSEPAKDWLVRRATGDWVLMLDDDEVLPHDADQVLPPLLEDHRYTSYALPVRWVVRGPDGGLAWLRQFPWHSARWLRLARNLGGLVRVLPLMHTIPEVAGESCALPLDGPLVLYHLDLLWHDRLTRQAKVARYRAAAGHERPTCEEQYLYEDYARTLDHAPVPAGEDFVLERTAGRPTGGPPAGVGFVSLGELEQHALDVGADPPIWSADWLGHDTPARLPANRGHLVSVRVRNSSRATWRNPGDRRGRVALCYRWESEVWGLEVPVGDVTLLERALAPGEEAELLAGLWTPGQPGRYILTWDMVCEDVAWFSTRGSTPLRVPVEIVDDGPRPRAPHFPGPVHADQPADPAPTPSGRVVALPPVRVLDTRDGSGVVEAPAGRVMADDVVVLRLAGVAGVPQDAVGVFATVSVVDAGYGGFLTAYPTDGTKGQAFPHLYFAGDHRPVSATVMSALGRGRGHGRLSLHLSGGPPGAGAHLVVDLAGYLLPDPA